MQTKKENIGYILLGALDSKIPANSLKEIARTSLSIVNEDVEIDNWRTLDFAEEVGKKVGLNKEQNKLLRSGVYYQFDMKTEEEAGEYYEHFSKLFRVLQND